MLEAYKRLQANGVIGPMMKVDSGTGKPIHDPSGELPGQLVPRPFQEYPKAVRRVRKAIELDKHGNEHVVEKIVTLVAYSKSEELRMIAEEGDSPDERSPIEKERDALARDLNSQQQINGKLAEQMEKLMAQVAQLSSKMAGVAEKAMSEAAKQPTAPELGTAARKVETAEMKALKNLK